jgi:hypothetical protein
MKFAFRTMFRLLLVMGCTLMCALCLAAPASVTAGASSIFVVSAVDAHVDAPVPPSSEEAIGSFCPESEPGCEDMLALPAHPAYLLGDIASKAPVTGLHSLCSRPRAPMLRPPDA